MDTMLEYPGISLKKVDLPHFSMDGWCPRIPFFEYEERLQKIVTCMKVAGIDVLLVYADREHFANISYCTGFDPRFEEAVLLLDTIGNRTLIVGNECLGCLPDSKLCCKTVLYQEFSLLGQPRGESPSLKQIFTDFNITTGKTVGCAGWKYFEEPMGYAIEIPAYIVDLLRDLTGDLTRVCNANNIFMNPINGLRIINSVHQIAQFEYAQAITSTAIYNAMTNIHDGVTEYEIERFMESKGLPLTTHRTVRFGESMKHSLISPTDNCASIGDMWSMAMGLPGAMICRAGAIAGGPLDLDPETRDFYPRFIANYFDVLVTWYHELRVGACAGQVYQAVMERHNESLMTIPLNPGHYIHLDEWVHSPFTEGSNIILPSGCVLQADIIPRSQGPRCSTRAEEGVVLADASLRDMIMYQYPDCWKRMQLRRQFMIEKLGIQLDETVLPLSNTPGWIPPYLYSMEYALCYR